MTDVPESFAPRHRAAKSVGALIVLALLAAACSSTSTDTVSAAAGPESTETPTAVAADTEAAPADDGVAEGSADLSNYPAVVVKDIATGGDIEITDLIANGQIPTLLWFWAPH